jgi:hypothetical protein
MSSPSYKIITEALSEANGCISDGETPPRRWPMRRTPSPRGFQTARMKGLGQPYLKGDFAMVYAALD